MKRNNRDIILLIEPKQLYRLHTTLRKYDISKELTALLDTIDSETQTLNELIGELTGKQELAELKLRENDKKDLNSFLSFITERQEQLKLYTDLDVEPLEPENILAELEEGMREFFSTVPLEKDRGNFFTKMELLFQDIVLTRLQYNLYTRQGKFKALEDLDSKLNEGFIEDELLDDFFTLNGGKKEIQNKLRTAYQKLYNYVTYYDYRGDRKPLTDILYDIYSEE